MPSDAPPLLIHVHFEARSDGGLRAWSDDVPGFALSHSNPALVLADVEPVLEVMLSEWCKRPIKVYRTAAPGREDELDPVMPAFLCGSKDYVGLSRPN